MKANRIRHILLQIITLLLCAALLPQVSLAAGSKNPPESDIRVLLTRLNLADEAWMTLEGRYLARCADGTEVMLPAGAQITVLLRRNKLILFYDGLSLSAGQELTLLRRQDGDVEPDLRQGAFSRKPVGVPVAGEKEHLEGAEAHYPHGGGSAEDGKKRPSNHRLDAEDQEGADEYRRYRQRFSHFVMPIRFISRRGAGAQSFLPPFPLCLCASV